MFGFVVDVKMDLFTFFVSMCTEKKNQKTWQSFMANRHQNVYATFNKMLIIYKF